MFGVGVGIGIGFAANCKGSGLAAMIGTGNLEVEKLGAIGFEVSIFWPGATRGGGITTAAVDEGGNRGGTAVKAGIESGAEATEAGADGGGIEEEEDEAADASGVGDGGFWDDGITVGAEAATLVDTPPVVAVLRGVTGMVVWRGAGLAFGLGTTASCRRRFSCWRAATSA